MPPPQTISEALRQARAAYRHYREVAAQEDSGITTTEAAARSGGEASTSSPSSPASSLPAGQGGGPRRLIIEMPLPAQRDGFLGRGGTPPDLVTLTDEADYPGGELQRFRVVRKLVEGFLEGYEHEFLGFCEVGADGVGLWRVGADTCLIANVTNATVPSLLKLLDGGYGARASRPGSTVIAFNPTWTGDAGSVGQPWQRELRRRAREVMDRSGWETLYVARILRTSRGANGLLHRAWPGRWAVYPAASPDARYFGDCVLATPSRPTPEKLVEKLAEAKPAMQKKAKELGLEEPGWF